MGFTDPDQTPEDLTAAGSDVMRETGVRYAAYASRFGFFVKKAGMVGMKKIALKKATVKAAASKVSKVRHLAYSSDLGEAFRPVVPTWAVNATYGVAVSYVVADTAYRVYDAEEKGADAEEMRRVAAHATIFHAIASIGVPMAIIHTQVHVWEGILKRVGRFTKWGPTVAGLAIIPLLPYVDHPIEEIIDAKFEQLWPAAAAAAAKDRAGTGTGAAAGAGKKNDTSAGGGAVKAKHE